MRAALLHRVEPVISLRFLARGRGAYVGLRRRRLPFTEERPCIKGSQWLALDRSSLERVLVELAPTTRLRRLFERSIIADEACLQTVLSWRATRLALPPVSHVEAEPTVSVRILTVVDLDLIRASGSPFCRNVDPIASAELLDLLDADRREGSVSPLPLARDC